MAKAPFTIDKALTAIAIAFRNTDLIADQVLPRTPVAKQEFKYIVHNLPDAYTLPDTKVGRKSKPNEVEFGATEETGSTVDYALDDKVPMADILNSPENYDPKGRAVESILDLIQLDREKRTSDIVFNLNTYPSTNRETLSGTSQFSDFDNSNPIDKLLTALDVPLMRPNVVVLGNAVWSKLRVHPKVIKSIYGNNQDGVATLEQFARLLEVNKILVGKGYLNTAKKGQAMTLARVWGKHIAMIYQNSIATSASGTTFGATFQFGDRVAGEWVDENVGMRGGYVVRAGESVCEKVTAKDIGYFIQNAVA